MSDVFLSYAREDRSRVEPLAAALQKLGWSVWWDPHILPGETWDDVIDAALGESRCVIVLWSRESVGSRWVRTEAHEGHRRGILVPALLDHVTIPLAFRSIQSADLVDWRAELPHAGFEQLTLAVRKILSAGVPLATVAATVSSPQTPTVTSLLAGQQRENPIDGLIYVWIPPGTFTMGCSPGDTDCYDNEKPVHDVTLTRGFWLGQTPVTEAAYARFLKATGEARNEVFADSHLPVTKVSWEDARRYCEWAGMRLPTEAEWEYAARATTAGPRYGDLESVAWYKGNSGGTRHPVAMKQPNAWGLYDMLGNVWEWVADRYGGNYDDEKAATDPTGPSSGPLRVQRGGAWNNNPQYVRVSYRDGLEPSYRSNIIGFRCAGELR